MAHVSGQSRYQSTRFPPTPDDLVPADHQVRVIDTFVDRLDLAKLGFAKVAAEATGRPLSLFGPRIRSARICTYTLQLFSID
jgi:hypothetical protein